MIRTTLVVMVYDVADDRRRTKLHALLKQYGVPVQKSAFEARLGPKERERVLARVTALIDKSDRFVMYPVPSAHEEHIAVVGPPRRSIQDRFLYIV